MLGLSLTGFDLKATFLAAVHRYYIRGIIYIARARTKSTKDTLNNNCYDYDGRGLMV